LTNVFESRIVNGGGFVFTRINTGFREDRGQVSSRPRRRENSDDMDSLGCGTRGHEPMNIPDERRTHYGNRHDQDSTGPDNGRKT
jgi:hypothetical protein